MHPESLYNPQRRNITYQEFRQNAQNKQILANQNTNNEMHAHVQLVDQLEFAENIILDVTVSQTLKIFQVAENMPSTCFRLCYKRKCFKKL